MKAKLILAISLVAFLSSPGLIKAQTPSPIEEPLVNFDKLISNLKVSSVIGQPVRSGDTYIIPFAKISFGLGAGGAMMGYGGGMGGKTIPLGILIVEGENVNLELFPVEEKKPSFFQEMLPVILKMLPDLMKKKPAEKKPEEKAAIPEDACLDQVKKLFEEKKYTEAVEMADYLLEKDPKNADLHVWKGHAMGSLAQGSPMDMMKYGMGAMQEYEKALEIDPKNAGAHFGRGVGRLMTPPQFGGNLDGAIEDFEFACSKEPSPEAYFYLGEAYKKKGATKKAQDAYKKALELNPKYAQAAKALEEIK